MQDTLCCYLKLVYLYIDWIVEIPASLKVDNLISLLNQQFECEVKGYLLFDLKGNRILEGSKTFQENKVKSGDYLYLI